MHEFLRWNNFHITHYSLHSLLKLVLVLGHLLNPQRLSYDLFDRHPRIQRLKRVLEDNLHVSPQRLQLGIVELRNIDTIGLGLTTEEFGLGIAEPRKVHPVEKDRALCGLDQAQEETPSRRLSASALTCQSENLALLDNERDAINGFDCDFFSREA